MMTVVMALRRVSGRSSNTGKYSKSNDGEQHTANLHGNNPF